MSAVVVALLSAEHTASADDAPAQAETPAPDPGTGAPPTDGAVTPPTAPVTEPTSSAPVPEVPTTAPPVVDAIPGGSIDTPPATTVPGTPTAPGDESASPSVDGPLPAGTGTGTTTNQGAGVTTAGTAVANTGGNTGIATGTASAPLDETAALPGHAGAGISTGTASGQGSVDHTGISQQVNAVVTENGRIVVVQVAIVVNIGVGLAGSGGNTAGAESAALPRPTSSVGMIIGDEASGAGTGPTPVRINTGGASSTGNTGTTQVTQSIVLTGNDVASQLAAVLNIGVGVSNSGLNFALASVTGTNSGTPSSVTFVTMGGGSSISAGPATALGNRSTSAIFQVVTVTASGDGTLLVIQRAIIVNFGLGLANTGRNTAGSGVSAAMPDTAAAQQLLLALLAPSGSSGDSVAGLTGGGSGGGIVAISTGTAHAVGNDTTTGIHQQVVGSVTGEETARAIQDAWVGNFGIGVANSGGNLAAAGLGGIDSASLDAARSALQAFLAGLTGVGDPVQGLDGTFALGSNLLQLQGDVSGTETLLGITEPGTELGAGDASVVVRQVTAVLNIGLALGESGNNVAVADAHTTTIGGRGTTAVATTTINTGDALAVGNDFVTTVCQTIGDAVACAAPDPEPEPETPVVEVPDADPVVHPAVELPPPPSTPPADPFIPPAAPVRATVSTLPFTGAPIGAELAAGSGLLIAGMLMARRRRTKAAT